MCVCVSIEERERERERRLFQAMGLRIYSWESSGFVRMGFKKR